MKVMSNGSASDEEIFSREREPGNNYRVIMSGRVLLLSVVVSVGLAFAAGRWARIFLIEGVRRQATLEEGPMGGASQYHSPLPSFDAKDEETVPRTRYTFKTFDAAKSTIVSSWHNENLDTDSLEEGGQDASETCSENDTGGNLCNDKKGSAKVSDEQTETSSLPNGEHLTVDMENVDGKFLNSEPRLVRAMINVMNAANLTLLSYHCHRMVPTGVSCAGILIHSYVTFHTWPNEGVITFDLFAGSGESILPLLPVIEKHFAMPRSFSFPQPSTVWALKTRGFHDDLTESSELLSMTDYGQSLASHPLALKEKVTSVETDFQRIDIYDVIFEEKAMKGYKKSLVNDVSYESRHKSLFRPNRVIYLDGWIQSSLKSEAAYHEALVQPALFTHSNPKRVAIIGGGEGATLREVLKHNTIEKAFMIDIDEEMVIESRKHIPEWSDCSDLEGSTPWCGDDPRADVYYEDAHAWFMERYSGNTSTSGELDVVILDALDPESEIPFAQALYGNDRFMRAFFDALSDDGILVMQLGQAPKFSDPDETFSKFKNRATTTKLLEKLGFESVHAYEESHCDFEAPWTYVCAFKSYKSRQRWYSNAAEVDLRLQKRGVRTKSGKSPFQYFDGATMLSYQMPSRVIETVFCRQQPMPDECYVDGFEWLFDPDVANIPAHSFEVKQSGSGKDSGRGVFTKVDIPKESYLAAESTVHLVEFMPSTATLIREISEEDYSHDIEVVHLYTEAYGFSSQMFGDEEVYVDSSIMTFVNHGCRGSYNMGKPTPFDEYSADPDSPDYVSAHRSHNDTTLFNPVIDRHLRFQLDTSSRDIKAGEEILDNYLDFVGIPEYWTKDVMGLRALCSGQAVGPVTCYERGDFNASDPKCNVRRTPTKLD